MSEPSIPPIVFYGFDLSGHSHRAELFLKLLGLPYLPVWVDLAKGEQKAPEYLELHPFGQVPLINDGGIVVWDSAAILVYLAEKYGREWLPQDPAGRADVQHWLSIAAGPLAAGPAAARITVLFKRDGDLAAMQTNAYKLLATMDAFLNGRDWLAGGRPSIADLALYSYTAVSPEGGVDLARYPNIVAWIARLEALPRFYPMPRSKVGLWAD